MKTKCNNGNTVDHWYDPATRSSVTQVNDAAGNQIGDAQYSGNRSTAQATRSGAIKDNGGPMPKATAKAKPSDLKLFALVTNPADGCDAKCMAAKLKDAEQIFTQQGKLQGNRTVMLYSAYLDRLGGGAK